jgi:hypothetical protein
MKNMPELIMCVMLLIGHFIYMFVANYVGQILTDHSVDIFNTT